jgi:hypothetical protein
MPGRFDPPPLPTKLTLTIPRPLSELFLATFSIGKISASFQALARDDSAVESGIAAPNRPAKNASLFLDIFYFGK